MAAQAAVAGAGRRAARRAPRPPTALHAPPVAESATEPAAEAPNPFGPGTLRVTSVVPGRHPQHWALVAGSTRGDFPTRQERYLLQVATDQAALAG